ncbi:MAG: TrkH family potassium uptake protein [Candidatus Omnitrophica bacterium]|nr:TrkH family potassium uptake protein [Candidatus Omnitrophota bacterium]
MAIPLVVSLVSKEWNPALDFVIGFASSLLLGFILMLICYTSRELTWTQGMVVVSFSWILAAIVSAIPLYMSGHFGSFLDAVFDCVSGYSTTGLSLVCDLDHLSNGHNMWRHFMEYLGGQGIVIIGLTFLLGGGRGAFSMYVGEARDEKILPNVIQTARFIWLVSLVYLVVGTFVMTMAAFFCGMTLSRALLHGMLVFMAAWSTGGFAPQFQSILYYHSIPFEMVTLCICMIGALNFNLHYTIWSGNRKELWRNIEVVTFSFTLLVTFTIISIGLIGNGLYPESLTLFRKGLYHVISGHTTTGFQTLYSSQLAEWGGLALVGLIIAMVIGGSACSTAGGIKLLRAGLIFKAFLEDIKKLMSSESSVIIQKFHHIKDIILNDRLVRNSMLITMAYIFLYFAGAVIGMLLGYPALNSLFESVSAGANVGLSCGITSPSMPVILKITYILQMWTGRLEFISVFVFIGFIIAVVRGK